SSVFLVWLCSACRDLVLGIHCPPPPCAAPAGAAVSVLRRRGSGDLVLEDPGLCWTLRDNEEQWQLLCNDRRSKFNFNPLLSLRFGKRYVYRRAAKRARTSKLEPLYLLAPDQGAPPT
uniref:Uncharacterized protein n=1 Tax=Salarias fasciatus TaxID=181472 RepID=A0A672IKG2_SALFA